MTDATGTTSPTWTPEARRVFVAGVLAGLEARKSRRKVALAIWCRQLVKWGQTGEGLPPAFDPDLAPGADVTERAKRRWVRENREHVRAYARRWRAKNRNKVAQANRRYRTCGAGACRKSAGKLRDDCGGGGA